jgi:hypothetical protein
VYENAADTMRNIMDELIDFANDELGLGYLLGDAGRQLINIISCSKLN